MKPARQLTLFHSPAYLDECGKHPGRKVWLPDIPEARIYTAHLLQGIDRRGHPVYIEEGLPDLQKDFPEADIRRFRVDPATVSAQGHVVLYPQSDTLAASVAKIYRALDPARTHILVPRSDHEGAGRYLREQGLPFQTYSYRLLKSLRPEVLVNLNDWTKETQRIMAHCHWLGIPVVCVQESVIDFGDGFRRMQHADYAFVQGSVSYFNLDRELMFITGNPRYESLRQEPPARAAAKDDPARPVLINCNFTYDIHEDVRYQWLDQVTEQLDQLGMEYHITQHPRDHSDLSRYTRARTVRSGGVHEMIRSSSLLVTRFSSLIHESLLMGVPVIYYNPHAEAMRYDFEFNDKFLRLAGTPGALGEALRTMQNMVEPDGEVQHYLTRHCLPGSADPSRLIAGLLAQSHRFRAPFSPKDLVRMILFLPVLRKVFTPIYRIFMPLNT